MKKLILTHANCIDGCCSRAILEKIHGEDADYLAVDYPDFNNKFPDRYEALLSKIKDYKNTEVIMADICLSSECIDMFLENNNKVVILDHHLTSLSIAEKYEQRINNGEKLNIEIVFSKDNTESGAMVTWKHYHAHQPIPEVVQYVSEGDTYKFKSKETKPFYLGIRHDKEPSQYTPEFWMSLLEDPSTVKNIIDYGTPLFEKHMQKLETYASKAELIEIDGKKGYIVQAPRNLCSDLGDLLASKGPYFALMYEERDNIVACELRSRDPISVREIAEKLGGGGHTKAAGFRVSTIGELQNILTANNNQVKLLELEKESIITIMRDKYTSDKPTNKELYKP